ncbi:MAG: hypothetical protein NC078_00085 [Ruminococcus sp.]|nr:hypothetical protein [Ruminococcus sp.]
MNVKKILSAVSAGAVAVSMMATGAFAANVADGDINLGTDWSGTVIGADKFAGAAEGDTVTLTYSIIPADYNLISLCSGGEGWTKLEATQTATSADAGFKNQEDGFSVVTEDNTVVYTLTAADAQTLNDNGACIRGYQVNVTSVDFGGAVAAPEAEAETEAAPAADTGVSIDTVMVIQENATWATTKSNNVTITGAGDYTYTLSGLSIDPATLTVLYIKDASCVDSDPAAGYTATIPGGSAVVKSFKINGNDVALSGDSSLYNDAGTIIDMCFFNTWAAQETFFDAPADTIESVEVTISVSADSVAAPAPAAEEATLDDDVEVVADEADELVEDDAEEVVEVVEDAEPVAAETEAVVETVPVETEAPVVETAPVADTTTAPVRTGNAAVAAVAFVMVAAGAAAVVSKRK